MGKKRTQAPQAGAIVIKNRRVCIVTSSGGRSWVIPKGNLKGSFRRTASLEAWEEAGVRGKLCRRALTSFKYRKAGKTYRVKLYLLRASSVSGNWPEKKSRQRMWLPLDKAAVRLKYAPMRKAVQAALVRRAA